MKFEYNLVPNILGEDRDTSLEETRQVIVFKNHFMAQLAYRDTGKDRFKSNAFLSKLALLITSSDWLLFPGSHCYEVWPPVGFLNQETLLTSSNDLNAHPAE